jgi:hypothetical protein
MTSEEVKKHGPGFYFYVIGGTVIPVNVVCWAGIWRMNGAVPCSPFLEDNDGMSKFYPLPVPTAEELAEGERLGKMTKVQRAFEEGR